jgi:RES domain-containing protein
MEPHGIYDTAYRNLKSSRGQGTPWEGVIYRSVSPRYSSHAAIISGEGAARTGGRWNPPATKAVYGSLTPETAMAEALRHHRYYGIPITDVMPRLFVAIEVSVRRSMDLTDPALRAKLGLILEENLDEDWRREVQMMREPMSQAIGRAAFAAGIEVLLVPSSADRAGANVVVFPDLLSPGSRLTVLGDGA